MNNFYRFFYRRRRRLSGLEAEVVRSGGGGCQGTEWPIEASCRSLKKFFERALYEEKNSLKGRCLKKFP